MPNNDIYDSEKIYEHFRANYKEFVIKPEERKRDTKKRKYAGKYYCRYSENIKYFENLFSKFEARDTSYIRRNRLIGVFKLICYTAENDLSELDRDDIDKIVDFNHKVNLSPKLKKDFIKNLKFIWKILFTEKDEKGRLDETLVPYVVRHLNCKIDRSREKLREDRLTWEEFENLAKFFNNDPRIQAYLTFALESLGRPQEILFLKLKDVEMYDNYAKIYLSEHGKEGAGLLRCIDSFPYIQKWFNLHPQKDNREAYLFINLGTKNRYCQNKLILY